MKLGIAAGFSDRSANAVDTALAVEERGFESLWVGEHTHCPVDTVHRYSWDGHVPDNYKRFADPYTSLAAAAAVTSRIRLGTAIALPAEHNPITLAKTIATLDMMSGGRVVLGIGLGWNPLELENNGVDFGVRRRVLAEKIAAMRGLWSNDEFGFDGRYVKFSQSWAFPKPIQQPGPPILLGAAKSSRTFADVVSWCDGWLPVSLTSKESLEADIADLRRACDAAGRDWATVDITVIDPSPNRGSSPTHQTFVSRLPTADDFARYDALGVSTLILSFPMRTRSEMYRSLDAMVPLNEALVA